MAGARKRRRSGQDGHLMVGVVAMLAIMLILSTVATQKWEDVLQRENEAEMMFRAEEIVRAISRYQQDQGHLPTKLEDLLDPGKKGQYFIRRLYDDPLVKDGKWGLLYAAPGGGLYDPSNPQTVSTGEEIGSTSQVQTQSVGGLQSGFPGGVQETGGLPIAGVKTLCKKTPFRVYRGLTDYSQWLFSIFDLQTTQLPGQGKGRGPRAGGAPGGGAAGAPGLGGAGGTRQGGGGLDRQGGPRRRREP